MSLPPRWRIVSDDGVFCGTVLGMTKHPDYAYWYVSEEEAEGEALLFMAQSPEYIGRLRVEKE